MLWISRGEGSPLKLAFGQAVRADRVEARRTEQESTAGMAPGRSSSSGMEVYTPKSGRQGSQGEDLYRIPAGHTFPRSPRRNLEARGEVLRWSLQENFPASFLTAGCTLQADGKIPRACSPAKADPSAPTVVSIVTQGERLPSGCRQHSIGNPLRSRSRLSPGYLR